MFVFHKNAAYMETTVFSVNVRSGKMKITLKRKLRVREAVNREAHGIKDIILL